MNINDPMEKPAKLVIDAYRYALEHNLNIKSQNDVAIILKTLDPEHSSENDVLAFMPLLGAFDSMTKAELAKRGKQAKTEISN